jgi:Flagellar P-ring protein/HEAT repeats
MYRRHLDFRTARPPALPACGRLLAAATLGLLATLVGCIQGPTLRGQRAEESDRERYPVKLVGDVCTFDNAAPLPVSGVGLVEGLEGTGGPAPAGNGREALEHELRKERVPNVKEVLNSSDYSMVIVSALIPPGARKGDKLDIEVSLPPGSKTTSLQGGRLRRCLLHHYAAVGQLSRAYAGSDATLKGQLMAVAGGPLIVGFGPGGEAERMKQGMIWDGGACVSERPFHIIMNSNQRFAQLTKNLAERLNAALQGNLITGPSREVAVAKTNVLVLLNLPPQYKHNPQRYLRVVRLVPLQDTDVPSGIPYRQRLEQDLLDPARTVVAALRLESLGSDSTRPLSQGLASPDPLVRFCSAEALAYLGNVSCADELARVVRQQPYLRAYALTALASLDEAVSRDRLFDLMTADLDDEARYGAFRALRALDGRDAAVRGERLNSFWLHRVAPRSDKSLVHVSLSHRAEVVLFGKDHALKPPFSLQAGDFVVTATPGAQRCTISKVDPEGVADVSRTRCSLDLDAILTALAAQGASYAEVLDLLRQAESCRNLSCRLRHDALPQTVSVKQLAKAGKQMSEAKEVDGVQIVKPDTDLGATPSLYAADRPSRTSTLDRDVRVLQHGRKAKEVKEMAER